MDALSVALSIAEKSIELLCFAELQAPTAGYARALNHVVWHENRAEPIGDRLEPLKGGFLAVARRGIRSPPFR